MLKLCVVVHRAAGMRFGGGAGGRPIWFRTSSICAFNEVICSNIVVNGSLSLFA
jgi:hypothetical protein